MLIEIAFDKQSYYWEKDFEYNLVFVKSKYMYLTDLYRAMRYIYLNRIYEELGLAWNPHNENKCWIYERDGELEIAITSNKKLNEISFAMLYPERKD